MLDDLRQALRSIRKQPGFAAVAVLTLAFGIGVNTSIFSIVSAFFLQPLPVKDPHELVMVMQKGEIINVPYGHSFPDYLDYRKSVTALTNLVAFMPTPVHLSAQGQTPERTWVEVVSPNYFALGGVTPALGELLKPGEGESKGTAPTVVLAYRYWQRRFGGNPSIVGQPITLNGQSFTVVGIAPASFTGLSWAMAVSGWVPSGALGTMMHDGDAFRDNRGAPAWRLMGRLAPGKFLDQARAELEVVSKRLASAYPAEHKGTRVMVIPENRARPDPSVSEVLPAFAAVFLAMVTLVLFIACANVSNLMISRALARQRDLVIRSALGASRFRLMRLQVVEGLVLATIAGLVGLLLARWAGQALQAFTPTGDIPVNQDRPSDWRVYAFTFVISAIAGTATAFWPARHASRFNLVESLKEGARDAGSARHLLRNLLVVGQVSLSLVVLVSAGLVVHSLRQMQQLAMGFRSDGLLMMSVDLGLQQYADGRGKRFVDDLLTRAEALPGVASATVSVHVPFGYGIQVSDVAIDGTIPGTKDDSLSIGFNVVGPRFLETAGARLLGGRGLDRTDTEQSRRVALVNATMVTKLWPGKDAIGRRFRVGGREGDWVEVVGVVGDGKYMMVGEEPRPFFFLPLAQKYMSPITLMVRTGSEPTTLVAPLERILHEMDPDLPVFNVKTMAAHVRESALGLMPLRMGAAMAAGQGLIGLCLAVMGLYAVVSYAVTRRTREIGVRMALGAGRGDVVRLVVREGLRLTLIGIGLGLAASLGLGLVMSKVLYGVGAMNAGVYAGVTAVLLGVSAAACYLPARRATRVDPLVALRAE
jgi:putative ABC transport system permease protein